MATHRALVLESRGSPLQLKTVPTPTAETGSVIVQVECLYLLPYMRDVIAGTRPYALTLPQVLGPGCIGRIASPGPDTTIFKPGQLVLCDPTIRARDDPGTDFLIGLHGHGEGASKLMREVWRDGTFAEKVKMPLENVFMLDEEKLCKKLGYRVLDLPILNTLLIPFGGLDEAGVGPWSNVLIAPATGKFGGAAVAVALAMGARVTAAGRNREALKRLEDTFGTERLTICVLSGGSVGGEMVARVGSKGEDRQASAAVEHDLKTFQDAAGPKGFDVFFEINPPMAGAGGQTPSSIPAGIRALRHGGTCVIMGGILGDIAIPCGDVMHRNLRIIGKFMYTREQILKMIKMAGNGNLALGNKIGAQVLGEFGLESVGEALEKAEQNGGWGTNVALVP